MSESDPSEPISLSKETARAPRPIRASDAEREQVAEVVRRAVGDGRLTLVEGDERLAGIYASVHRGELERYMSDLGEGAPAVASDPVSVRRVSSEVVDRPSTTSSVAIMSGAVRKGAWTPGHTHVAFALMGGAELTLRDARLGGAGLAIDAVALMGGVDIDLRGADIGPAGVTVRAVAFWGGIDVLVDPDTRVEENGLGLMGGFADESGPPARADGPVVRVVGVAIMGGVSVHRRAPGMDEAGRPELPDDGSGGHSPRGIHGGQ